MNVKIAPPAAPTAAEPRRAAADAPAKTAAREFEAMLVRSLLNSTVVSSAGGAYGDMGVDALARTITGGTGLGLQGLIERSLDAHRGHAPAPAKTAEPTEPNDAAKVLSGVTVPPR